MPEDLYDSDNPDAIPSGVHAAGYINGYAANIWATRGYPRFPNAKRISVFLANDGDVCDVERGDLMPWEAPEWVQMALARGVPDPWVYVNLSNWPATRTEFTLRGMPQPSYWVADYDGVKTIPAGAIAKQYANPAIIPGNPHYDLSVVADGVFGGSGGIITAQVRRTTILASTGTLHQFGRGTDNALYHRKVVGGVWSSWTSLGGTLFADTISGGTDDQGILHVSVIGQPIEAGKPGAVYDISSADDGATWSPFSGPHGTVTGLVTLGAAAQAGGTEPPEPAEPARITLNIPSVPGTATGTIS